MMIKRGVASIKLFSSPLSSFHLAFFLTHFLLPSHKFQLQHGMFPKHGRVVGRPKVSHNCIHHPTLPFGHLSFQPNNCHLDEVVASLLNWLPFAWTTSAHGKALSF